MWTPNQEIDDIVLLGKSRSNSSASMSVKNPKAASKDNGLKADPMETVISEEE